MAEEIQIIIDAEDNATEKLDSIIASVTEVTGSFEEMADMIGDVNYAVSDLSQPLGEVNNAVEDVTGQTVEMNDATEEATSLTDILSGAAAAAAATFVAVGAAIYGAVTAIWSFVEAAGESEIAEWRLEQSLNNLGETASVTFGGMSEDAQKALDKLVEVQQKANDKLLDNQMDYEDKLKQKTSDVMLDIRRFDEDTRDAREKLADDMRDKVAKAEEKLADTIAKEQRKISEAKTKEARRSAQINAQERIQDAQQALAQARADADERLAEFDKERAKRRARMQEDTARDLQEAEAKYKKEQELLQQSIDETNRKIAAENEAAAANAAKTVEIIRPTKDEVLDLAEEISNASGFDDEELIGGMTKLLRLVPLASGEFEDFAKYAADLAAVGDKDLGSAFQSIAMFAKTGDLGRLARDIKDLTPAQQEALKAAQESGNIFEIQAVALEILRDNFGDAGTSAAEYGTKFEGLMGKVETALGNIQEALGGPALAGIAAALQEILPSVQEAGAAFAKMLGDPEMQQRIKDFGTWIGESLVPLIEKGINWLSTEAPILLEKFKIWWDENTPMIKQKIDEVGSVLSNISAIAGPVFAVLLASFAQFTAVLTIVTTPLRVVFDLVTNLKQVFSDLSKLGFVEWLGKVADGFSTLAQKILGLVLPDWLTPGSPTPLEIGIRGISDALGGMNPLTAQMSGNFAALPATAAPGPAIGGGVTVVYSPTFSAASAQEFQTKLVPLIDQQLNANQRRRVERR